MVRCQQTPRRASQAHSGRGTVALGVDRRDIIGRNHMPWRDVLSRTSLIVGLIALGLSIWGGMHLQHLIDDKGNRHLGETVVLLVLALLMFTGCWYGARRPTRRE